MKIVMDGADIQSRIKCEDHATEKQQYLHDFSIAIQSYTDEALTEELEFFQDAADYWINHSSNMSNHANLVKAEIDRRAK